MLHCKLKSLLSSSSHLVKLTYCDYDSNEYNKHIGKTFTKKEFYNKFPNFNPYKVIQSDMTHLGYKYNIGLNKIDKFIDCGVCCGGGFYLVNNTNIGLYFNYGENIAKILLPYTTMIYLEVNKIKVSELVIENIISKNEYFVNLDKKSRNC